jgi:hypothetical protein
MDDETSRRHPLQVPGRGHGVTFIGTDGWIRVDRGNLEASRASLLETRTDGLPVSLIRSADHHENFVNAIRRSGSLASPVDASGRSDALYHLDQIAIKLQRTIRWDPEREEIIGDDEANRMLDRPMRAPWKI